MSDAAFRALTRAREAWPAIHVPDEVFLAYLTERAVPGEGETIEAVLATMKVGDLYLACACGTGDSQAIRAFDAAYAADIDAAYRRFKYVPRGVEDVKQVIQERLFVAEAGKSPKIADYAGRGDLKTWLRVSVTRLLINISSRESREIPAEDDIFLALPEPADPAAAHLRQVYRAQLREAFTEAVDMLSTREKNLLRYGFADGLSVDEIGTLYNVHRATAARWLAQAREALGSHVRTCLMERLAVSQPEFESILRSMLSQVDLTLERYFKRSP